MRSTPAVTSVVVRGIQLASLQRIVSQLSWQPCAPRRRRSRCTAWYAWRRLELLKRHCVDMSQIPFESGFNHMKNVV